MLARLNGSWTPLVTAAQLQAAVAREHAVAALPEGWQCLEATEDDGASHTSYLLLKSVGVPQQALIPSTATKKVQSIIDAAFRKVAKALKW
jgi:hypothetical protein